MIMFTLHYCTHCLILGVAVATLHSNSIQHSHTSALNFEITGGDVEIRSRWSFFCCVRAVQIYWSIGARVRDSGCTVFMTLNTVDYTYVKNSQMRCLYWTTYWLATGGWRWRGLGMGSKYGGSGEASMMDDWTLDVSKTILETSGDA